MSAPPAKLSFSLGAGAASGKRPPPAAGSSSVSGFSLASGKTQRPQLKPPAGALGFGDDEDDDQGAKSAAAAGPSRLPLAGTGTSKTAAPRRVIPSLDSLPSGTSAPGPSNTSHKASLLKQPASISRAARKVQEEAQRVDASVFEYDEVFDGMKEAQRAVEQRREEESAQRKVGAAAHRRAWGEREEPEGGGGSEAGPVPWRPQLSGYPAAPPRHSTPLVEHTDTPPRLTLTLTPPQPKYIDAFLASAKQRNLDKLRAEEKMLQHERDREGDAFVDKDKFVTGAYKKQMEEVRRAEEEEREKEGRYREGMGGDRSKVKQGRGLTPPATAERDRKSKTGPGMTSFYRTMLDADEERHAAAMAAASASAATKAARAAAGPSLAIKPPSAAPAAPAYDPEPESDAYLRREAALHAAASATAAPVVETLPATSVVVADERVEVNDDGAIVDHRVLLKAGLNITKKPVAPMPSATDRAAAAPTAERYVSRAVGAAATPAERAARERTRLAGLVREEEERRAREVREKERAEEDAARRRSEANKGKEGERKRREARERFEQRKRQRLAEGAKAGGDGE